MEQYQGIGVFGAYAIGKIKLLKPKENTVHRVNVADTGQELKRLEKAKERALEELHAIYEKALKEVGEANAQIFEIHMLMLEDEDYNKSITSIVCTQKVNAEYAVATTADNFASMFAAMDDTYMRARAADVRDISNRLLEALVMLAEEEAHSRKVENIAIPSGNAVQPESRADGEESRQDGEFRAEGEENRQDRKFRADGEESRQDGKFRAGQAESGENNTIQKESVRTQKEPDVRYIICASDLAPSETVLLDKDAVLAFVTAHGSSNSHTAILARNLTIPAVIGVGDEFMNAVSDGDVAIVDGYTGIVYLNPDGETLERMQKKQEEDEAAKRLLLNLKGKETVTLDGRKINLYANIGGVDQIGAVLLQDAEGIGLFRSEFLYLENSDYPSEEVQLAVYKRVLESMAGKKVIIRTLDIGADKQADYFGLEREENPALGLRAIRLCLSRPALFRTQLRALYRASVYGELAIMFPMIISVREVEETLALCRDIRQELKEGGMEYSEKTELGIMIETPAAAIISDQLAPLVDFFSIGTNDLIQYTLACDRQNPQLERFCDTHHEAVLRLIAATAENAHKYGKWVGICGELAADTTLTEKFLRMGVDELSVSPAFVLKVRDTVRKIDLGAAGRVS